MGNVRREFTHYGRAWYRCEIGLGGNLVDDVCIDLWEDDVPVGSFHVEWVDLGNSVAPRLTAFNDSWAALAAMPEVVKLLGEQDSGKLAARAFCELLGGLGFKDVTPRQAP